MSGEPCIACDGDGWVREHSDACYDAAECVGGAGCPKRTTCPLCMGTGTTGGADG